MKTTKQFQNIQLEQQIKWTNNSINYQILSNDQINQENKKILETLKIIQIRINKQIQNNKQQKAGSINKLIANDQYKILQEKYKNKQKIISALLRDQENIDQRTNKISSGLQSKVDQHKFNTQKQINQLKQQIRKMKLQQQSAQKKLINHQDLTQFEGCNQYGKLQQQLRCFSIKYVRLLDSYNKSVQKLALAASQKQDLKMIEIPQEIYNDQLQKRQQQQYKQYQSIIKLCTVLEKRNQSQHNKSHRIYMERLKELEKIINNLGQIDRMIVQRQADVVQSRKYVQIMKEKIGKGNTYQYEPNDTQGYSLKSKTYSTVKLFKQRQQLKKRGFSFARLLPVRNSTTIRQ